MIRSGCSSMALSKASAPSPRVCTDAKCASACRRSSSTMGLSSTSRTLMLLGMRKLLSGLFTAGAGGTSPYVGSALAARFALQNKVADGYALIQRLAHVIDRESSHTGSDHRFHLHPGLGCCCGSGTDPDAILAHLCSHINEGQGQRMAH